MPAVESGEGEGGTDEQRAESHWVLAKREKEEGSTVLIRAEYCWSALGALLPKTGGHQITSRAHFCVCSRRVPHLDRLLFPWLSRPSYFRLC